MMRYGIHTIRGGIKSGHNPTAPISHLLNNGNYKQNLRLVSVENFPAKNTEVAGVQDKLWADTVFFVVATTANGAIPQTTSALNPSFSDYALRLSDSRQIAWGIFSGSTDYNRTYLDPDHILTDDIYVNAYQLSSAGNLVPIEGDWGYMLKFEIVDNSGAEGLLYAARDEALNDS
tara:strand:- start:203 stop:727 length:525 start_codon:yes stop_codon:yes gene_type:complete